MSVYKDGDIVWVQWGTLWRPAEVWSNTRLPEDITSSLRKPVIAIVKFFQEDSFQFVRRENHIAAFDCENKMKYINKGMDKFRSSSKMINFPAEVAKAEQLTGRNANFFSTLDTSAAPVITPTPDFAKKAPLDTLLSTPVSASTSKSSSSSSVSAQNTTSSVPSDNKFTCTMCSFSTDRMNLLMMHIKSHSLSRVNSPSSSSSETWRPVVARNSLEKSDSDDGIAEDVRIIKESMKELVQQKQPAAPTKKTKTPVAAKSAPKVRSQAPKREKKSNITKSAAAAAEVLSSTSAVEETKEPVAAAEKLKTDTHGLKNELLPDWPIGGAEKADLNGRKKEDAAAELMKVSPAVPEKASKQSRSTRNIPKKQRVSELNKTVTTVAASKEVSSPSPQPLPVNEDVVGSTKNTQKATKRNRGLSDSIKEPEKKKLTEDKNDGKDSKLLIVTAELLNETKVPKSTNSSDISATPASTNSTSSAISAAVVTPPQQEQQKNDKERNHDKSKSKASVNDDNDKVQISPAIVAKVDRQELILPHKKKQSSRLMTTTEKQALPVREMKHGRAVKATAINNTPTTTVVFSTDGVAPSQKSEQTPASTKNKRNMKSLGDSQKQLKSDTMASDIAVAQSENATVAAATTPEKRGQKRRAPSRDSDWKFQPDLKKYRKSDSRQPRSITVSASGSETICITSSGMIFKAPRDSIKTTFANSRLVTSCVTLSEATTKAPIVISKVSNTVTTPSSSQAIKMSPKLSSKKESQQQQKPKNALKVPSESTEEMKKQRLVTVENNRANLKGRQKFKELQNEQLSVVKTSTTASSSVAPSVAERACEQNENKNETIQSVKAKQQPHNLLVPCDGEIAAEVVQDAAYWQLSSNSNIIINTPNGQKFELSHDTILALQEQADESGIVSVELLDEQLELDVNDILKAISAQQQDLSKSGDMLSAVLDLPLIRDPSVATQVSDTLSKPIMSCTVTPKIAIKPSAVTETVSKNLNIEDSLASIGVKTAPRSNVPNSLESSITVTNTTIADTANQRKLAKSILGTEAIPETFIVIPSTDNRSVDN